MNKEVAQLGMDIFNSQWMQYQSLSDCELIAGKLIALGYRSSPVDVSDWPRFDGVPIDPNHPHYGTDSGVPSKWYNIHTGQRQDS